MLRDVRKLKERTYSTELLDVLRDKLGLTSDNQLAQALGCRQSTISGYRTGHRAMDANIALLIQQKAGIPLQYTLACAQADRARDPALKTAWEMIAKRALAEAA